MQPEVSLVSLEQLLQPVYKRGILGQDMRNKFLGTGQAGYDPKRKLLVILSGLRYAVLYDFSVAYKMVISVVFLTVAVVFHRYLDVLLLLLSTGLMLISEIVNTTIEALCDFVEERHNEKIKIIKDMAAAAAGIAIFIWIAVLTSEIVQMWQIHLA